MGIKIALTGMIVFLCVILFIELNDDNKVSDRKKATFGLIAIGSLVAILAGSVMVVWVD